MPNEKLLDARLRAIADPVRRKILQSLQEKGSCAIGKSEGLCASDIEARIGLAQSTVSHHMAVLRKAGLVEAKKVGFWMWYRRSESSIRELARSLKEAL